MHPHRYAPWVGALLVVGLGPVAAQNDAGPERCISLNRVDRTEVIDDRTLIFHMRNGTIYLNHLERECPGLRREERFMYSPTGNRLCDVDTITVLEQWGFGLTRGFTCGLAEFHPINEVDLAELRRASGRGSRDARAGSGDFEVVPVDPADLEALKDEEAEEQAADEATEE